MLRKCVEYFGMCWNACWKSVFQISAHVENCNACWIITCWKFQGVLKTCWKLCWNVDHVENFSIGSKPVIYVWRLCWELQSVLKMFMLLCWKLWWKPCWRTKKTTVTFNFLFQIFGIGHIYIIKKINKTLTLINTWHLYGVHCHILSIVTIFNIQRYPWHPEICSCYSDRIFLWEDKDFTFVGPLRFRWCLPLVSKQSRSTLHLLHTMDFPDSPLLLHLLVS